MIAQNYCIIFFTEGINCLRQFIRHRSMGTNKNRNFIRFEYRKLLTIFITVNSSGFRQLLYRKICRVKRV